MISNFAGINEIEDLPAEYLSTIYDEISQSEIKMKGQLQLERVQLLASGQQKGAAAQMYFPTGTCWNDRDWCQEPVPDQRSWICIELLRPGWDPAGAARPVGVPDVQGESDGDQLPVCRGRRGQDLHGLHPAGRARRHGLRCVKSP